MTLYKPRKNIRAKRRKVGLGQIVLGFLMIISVCFMGFLYIFQTNSLVEYSYRMRQLNEKIEILQKENQNLEAEIVRFKSPANIEKSIEQMDMIEVKNIIYLEKGKPVAVKN